MASAAHNDGPDRHLGTPPQPGGGPAKGKATSLRPLVAFPIPTPHPEGPHHGHPAAHQRPPTHHRRHPPHRRSTQVAVPTAPGSRCTEPGCGTITTTGRCDRHQRKAWQNPSANTRTLTGRQRTTIRARQLRREPACRVCGSTEDLEVDHIIPVASAGAALSDENLQTLCGTHHREKSALERRTRLQSHKPPTPH